MTKTLWDAITRGTAAALPTDSTTLTRGRLYFATDTGILYLDIGTGWAEVRPVPQAHTHAQSDVTGLADALAALGSSIGSAVGGLAASIPGTVAGLIAATPLDALAGPDGSLDMNGQRVVNSYPPSADGDLATKGYVDSAVAAGGGAGETFGIVFTNSGDVALRGDASPATKRY